MRGIPWLLVILVSFCVGTTAAQEVKPSTTEMACSDFQWTPEAAMRFANYKGACESIVEINGHTYGKFSAIVERVSSNGVKLTLKKTDHTFTAHPGPDLRVLLGKDMVKPGDLQRGDEITIYLSTDQFAQPAVTEVEMTQEGTQQLAPVPVEPAETLPKTASWLPSFVFAGAIAVVLGALMLVFARRIRA